MVCPVIKVLHFYISTFRSTCAVPKMAVFCSSLMCASQLCCSRAFWMILKWCNRCPYYDYYHLCFRIPRMLYFYCTVFVFQNLFRFLLRNISISWNCSVYLQTHCFVGFTDYDARFSVWDGSVSFHLLFHTTVIVTCFYRFRYMLVPVFLA